MRKYVVIGALSVFIIGVSLYFRLGGNADLVFAIEHRKEQIIYGHLFAGRPTEQRLEAQFIDARERSIQTQKNLVVVTFDQDSVPLKQFIGTLHDPEDTQDLDTLMLGSGKYVSIEIESHNLVMPRPDEIKSAAEEFAVLKGHKIKSELSYEIYQGDSALVVMFRCY